MELTRQVLPSLAHEKPLQICYISSGLALVPQASAAVYCATKAGLHAFAKGLRGQLRKTAPQVKIIEALPPLVDTDMGRAQNGKGMSVEKVAQDIWSGISKNQDEIYLGQMKIARHALRLAPKTIEKRVIDG